MESVSVSLILTDCQISRPEILSSEYDMDGRVCVMFDKPSIFLHGTRKEFSRFLAQLATKLEVVI